jgi:hypothetical protein
MKHLHFLLLSIFLFSFNGIRAQQNHYLYIQTENKQPFYLRLENKQYSSSISGYLIVPKLKDGNYKLTIGFPKNEWPEQNLECTIADNDIGYLLKNFDPKGWGLFNLQTLAVIMARGKDKPENIEVVNKTDAFSNMLSSVVNDSTIRQTETVKEDVKKAVPKEEVLAVKPLEKEVPQSLLVVDTLKTNSSTAEVTAVKKPDTIAAVASEKLELVKDQWEVADNKKSVISRSMLRTNGDGTEMAFIDDINGKKDTIRIFIPADKIAVNAVENPVKIKSPADELKTVPVKQEDKPKDTRFLEIELPNPNQQPVVTKPVESKVTEEKIDEKKSTETTPVKNKPVENNVTEIIESEKKVIAKDSIDKPVAPSVQRAVMINSDCKSFATDEDFLKLRKKMAAETNDDGMVVIAKKVFKVKCFTVEQIKNLSVLFLKDAGKYAFFDMTYPYTADSHNFHILQSQLTDAYFISRFQAMIRH